MKRPMLYLAILCPVGVSLFLIPRIREPSVTPEFSAKPTEHSKVVCPQGYRQTEPGVCSPIPARFGPEQTFIGRIILGPERREFQGAPGKKPLEDDFDVAWVSSNNRDVQVCLDKLYKGTTESSSYDVRFTGRKTITKGAFGHMGMSDNEISISNFLGENPCSQL